MPATRAAALPSSPKSVRQLAGQTEQVSRDIISRLRKLSASVEILQKQNRSNADKASAAVERSETIDADLRKFHVFGENVASMTTEISGISEPVERANAICGSVLEKVTELDRMAQGNAAKLADTRAKFDHLVAFSEDMILLVEESGIETADTPIIRALCRGSAKNRPAFRGGRRFRACDDVAAFRRQTIVRWRAPIRDRC